MDERKEKWLHGLEYGSIENHDHQMVAEAAKLIRAYEAERSAIRLVLNLARPLHPSDGVRDSFFQNKESDMLDAERATDNTWKEALNAE